VLQKKHDEEKLRVKERQDKLELVKKELYLLRWENKARDEFDQFNVPD